MLKITTGCLRTCIALGVLKIISLNIYAQDQIDYAEYLFNDQDYFRAISIYKQIMFFTDNAEIQNYCLFQIVRAYYKSNRYKASIKYISRLLNQPNLPDRYFPRSQIYLGLNYYGLKIYPMAEDYFNRALSSDTTGLSLFYLALLKAEKEQWKEASELYQKVHRQFPYSNTSDLADELSKDVLMGSDISKRSSFLSALLSTVIPGSGQFYNHHYYDGIQAFLFVGTFTFATFAAYRYDKNFNNNFLTTYAAVSITAIFHLANIIGAQRTAKYYNLRQKEKFLRQIREKAFSVEDQE